MKQFKTLFCLIFLTALFNCEQDDFASNDNQNATQSQFKVTDVNKEFVFSNTYISNKLSAIKSNTDESINSEYSRGVHNEEHGFTIETENVKFVENNVTGFHSYNFNLKRDNPENDKIENLVFHLNASGTYDVYIVEYDFTEDEYETSDLNQLNSLSTKYTSISLDELETNIENNKTFICAEEWLWVTSNFHSLDSGQLHGISGTMGSTGTCIVPGCTFGTSAWVLQSVSCSSTGDGPNSGYNGPTNTPYEGPNGYGTNSNPFVSAPNYTQPWENVQKCMNGFGQPNTADNTVMDLIMIDWLKANKHKAGKIQNFLGESGCSEEAQEIMLDVTSIMITNPNMDFEEAFELYLITNSDTLIDTYFVESAEDPIINMESYLSCLDSTSGATVTIHSDQPDPDNPNRDSWLGDVGHAFITIQQGDNIATFGFYPANGIGYFSPTDGTMEYDEEHDYSVSITIDILPGVLDTLITHSINFANTDYSLENVNCTSFVISASNIVGFDVPLSECIGQYTIGEGATPAAFGEYIRNMDLPQGSTRNPNGGIAPLDSNCN